jgi:CRISPR/Cas system CMR-associated protein Cmr1 (group 7 of RAMP superfamily)
MPQAWCGASFRSKFEKIVWAMEKDRKKKSVLVLNVSVSAEAKKIADEYLTNMNCSGRDVTKLYPLVELTIQGWRGLIQKLRAAGDKTSSDLFDKLKSEFGSSQEFAQAWWVHVEDVTSTWGKWGGDLKSMTFRPDHWAFKDLVQKCMPDDRGLFSKLNKKLEELK